MPGSLMLFWINHAEYEHKKILLYLLTNKFDIKLT